MSDWNWGEVGAIGLEGVRLTGSSSFQFGSRGTRWVPGFSGGVNCGNYDLEDEPLHDEFRGVHMYLSGCERPAKVWDTRIANCGNHDPGTSSYPGTVLDRGTTTCWLLSPARTVDSDTSLAGCVVWSSTILEAQVEMERRQQRGDPALWCNKQMGRNGSPSWIRIRNECTFGYIGAV